MIFSREQVRLSSEYPEALGTVAVRSLESGKGSVLCVRSLQSVDTAKGGASFPIAELICHSCQTTLSPEKNKLTGTKSHYTIQSRPEQININVLVILKACKSDQQ